jgi:hypothetical protein
MIVSSAAASRVVSLLEYRKSRSQCAAAASVPVALPFGRPARPVTARQARHRERMLEHMASLARRSVRPGDPARRG